VSSIAGSVLNQLFYVDLGTRMVVREIKLGSMNLNNRVWLVDPMSLMQTYTTTSSPTIVAAFGTS
jgi:hypothetical protein